MLYQYKQEIERQTELYRQLFEYLETDLKRKATVYDYHDLYRWCMSNILLDINTKLMTFEFDRDEMINLDPSCNPNSEFHSFFDDSKKKLDVIFDEYASKIEAKPDIAIKDFPERADKKEREVLNKLALSYLIKKDLLPNNKYSLTLKSACKGIVKELLKLGYNQNSGFIFMNQFIEYHVDQPTIQNYFRICKKDIPIYRPKNV